MMRKLSAKWGLWISFGLYTIWMLWTANGGVMRESDQASLLDGAYQLARDGGLIGASFYNYDVQYGSYWILAAFFKLIRLDVIGINPIDLVRTGNILSCIVFLFGIFSLCSRWQTDWRMIGWLGVILCSPVFLFSIPLLSSNFISGGVLCILAACLVYGKRSYSQYSLIAFLSFVCVASRADAVLVFPWLCFLLLERLEFRVAIKDIRIWAMIGGSIIALSLGHFINSCVAVRYASFFVKETFMAYLTFGLGFTGIGLLFILFRLSRDLVLKGNLWYLLGAVSSLLPFWYYGRILFTPRHLTATAIVVLLTLFFERGRVLLGLTQENRMGSLMVYFAVAGTLGMSFVGIRLDSLRSGRLVFSEPTLFPTADGFWPMGCQFQFSKWLAEATDKPVDHNQRVWAAWVSVGDISEVFKDDTMVESDGLRSYGLLRLRMMGIHCNKLLDRSESSNLLTDDRTLLRNGIKLSVDGEIAESEITWPEGGFLFGKANWSEIYLCRTGELDLRGDGWSRRINARTYTDSDDYVFGVHSSPWHELRGGGLFRWLTSVSSKEALSEPWVVCGMEEDEYFYECISRYRPKSSGKWLARSSLPHFMSRKNYGQN